MLSISNETKQETILLPSHVTHDSGNISVIDQIFHETGIKTEMENLMLLRMRHAGLKEVK